MAPVFCTDLAGVGDDDDVEMYVKFICNVAPRLGTHAKNYSFVNMKSGCCQLGTPVSSLSLPFFEGLSHFISQCIPHYYTTHRRFVVGLTLQVLVDVASVDIWCALLHRYAEESYHALWAILIF